MKISLAVLYSKLPNDVPTAEALSRFLITESITRRYPQGMPRLESRLYAKLLDQFYEEKPEIEIDEPTFLLILETLDQSVLSPHCSSWKWSLLSYLQDCAAKETKNG